MVKFKTLRYKHRKHIDEIYDLSAVADGEEIEINVDPVLRFAVTLCDGWDFCDADTGEALPVTAESVDELSLPQVTEFFREFNARIGINVRMGGDTEPAVNEFDGVKKKNGASLTSSSTKRKRVKKAA